MHALNRDDALEQGPGVHIIVPKSFKVGADVISGSGIV